MSSLDCPGGLNVITGVLKLEDISQLSLKSEGGVAMEQCSERLLTMKMEEVEGHKLRKVGDLCKLEKKKRKHSLLDPLEGRNPAGILNLSQ